MTPDPTTDSRRSTRPPPGEPGTSAWVGWIAFAALMLALIGAVHLFEGLVGFFNEGYYESRGSRLLLHLDLSSWAWLHVAAGALLLVAAVGVLGGWLWARALGTLVAIVSALVNVAFLAAQPVWSAIMVTLCIVVVLALTVHGGEIRPDSS